jgi:sulfotransferase family protein
MINFDLSVLKQAVERETGLSDWGDTPYEIALQKLCDTAAAEPRLQGPAGEAFAHMLKGAMAKRLKLYDDRKHYPEIPRQEITAPLVVTGLPRSGTTILHALLAQDPAARSPMTWEVAQPSPPPRGDTFNTDPRIAATEAFLSGLDPTFRAMHKVGATLPEECNAFTTMAFLSPNFAATNPLRPYAQWLFREADVRPAYALHRQTLQHFQAFAPREFWILKSPPHLFWLDVLFETYPDARVVVTHRDPTQILPSNASLIAYLLEQSSGPVDKALVGREQTDDWRLAVKRAMAFRENSDMEDRFIDVQYSRLIDEPIAVVESIYRHFGMELSKRARECMQSFMQANEQGKHGIHHYSAEEFGMSQASIHADFKDYIEQYEIPITTVQPI